jgi:hypothetical protein
VEGERQYDGSRFNNHVCSDFSFEDHNPPTIKMILAFCQHAEAQLKEMADRTLVIHCKAGKVRLNNSIVCCTQFVLRWAVGSTVHHSFNLLPDFSPP